MSRIALIRTKHLPYHLYGRSNNRESFYLPLKEVWKIFTAHLQKAVETRGLQIHAFVLMPNHYHLLASALGESIDRIMCTLLKGVSDDINRRANRINHVFGGPYKWSLIGSWFSYHHVYRYIYQNPLRARLAERAELYPYTTARQTLLLNPGIIPTAPHPFEANTYLYLTRRGYDGWQDWVNDPYDEEHVEALRRSLYRRKFKLCKNRVTRALPWQFVEPASLDQVPPLRAK